LAKKHVVQEKVSDDRRLILYFLWTVIS
jgi:hypothetical protein